MKGFRKMPPPTTARVASSEGDLLAAEMDVNMAES